MLASYSVPISHAANFATMVTLGNLQVCAAVGLCDQSGGRQMPVSHSRKLLVEEQKLVGDDTFCQFCTMAVSYIKVCNFCF